MTNNLELWDKVRRVPQEHLKGFTRGGGFKGTAIKPMWSVHTMTEQFGPCGKGWGIEKPEFTIQNAGNEILVFCTVAVWHNQPVGAMAMQKHIVYGVGGDKVLAQFSSGLKSDDEAFKKAFTDAVGNALKFLGVGADIHMGLWDGNKYVDETPEKPAPKTTPKAEARPEYARMSANIKTINDTGTIEDLRLFYKNNVKVIEGFDQSWQEQIMREFDAAVAALKAKAA